jgi:hypothetical protein
MHQYVGLIQDFLSQTQARLCGGQEVEACPDDDDRQPVTVNNFCCLTAEIPMSLNVLDR